MPSGIYKRTKEHTDKIKHGLTRPDVFEKLSSGRKGKAPWNKGMKTGYNSKQAEKMKGRTAWNKGLKGMQTWSDYQREVMAKRPIGEQHSFFTGTNLNYYKRIIKIRDDYTCQICGLKDVEIMEVDHILPVSTHPELRLDTKNMRVLCPNCHVRKSVKEKRKINGLAVASIKKVNNLTY